MLRKVLIVAYYWPPKGGVGVLRWLKTAKYLPEFGWQPLVLTPTPSAHITQDSSLLDEAKGIHVINHPIKEPYGAYNLLRGKKKDTEVKTINVSDGKPGVVTRLANFIRGNFFIPDARKNWIKPASKVISDLVRNEKIDAIVSTGPPHSMHLAVLHSELNNVPWIADFRDPWTDIDFVDDLYMTGWAKKRNAKLEQEVLRTAEQVVTVSPSWGKLLADISGRKDIKIINNGYDTVDFEGLEPNKSPNKITFSHIGTMNRKRNTEELWCALQKLIMCKPELTKKLRLQLIGQVDAGIFESLRQFDLLNYTEHLPQLDYREALSAGSNSNALILPIQNFRTKKGRIPAKLYEYLAVQNPIIYIGPKDSDAAHIIKETTNNPVFGYHETDKLTAHLSDIVDQTFQLESNTTEIAKYSRRNLTGQYAALLGSL